MGKKAKGAILKFKVHGLPEFGRNRKAAKGQQKHRAKPPLLVAAAVIVLTKAPEISG